MNLGEKIGVVMFSFGLGVAGGLVGGQHVVERALAQDGAERAEAKATFRAPNEVVIEFPSVVRGRRIQCTVWADTRRKISSIMC